MVVYIHIKGLVKYLYWREEDIREKIDYIIQEKDKGIIGKLEEYLIENKRYIYRSGRPELIGKILIEEYIKKNYEVK